MPTVHAHSQFFGLDVSSWLHDLRAAWCGMLAWPILAWLQPSLPVRLWLPTGQQVASRGPGTPHRDNKKAFKVACFDAVLMPDHLLLRSQISLPMLQPEELSAALNLQVSGLSPFPLDDLVWTHQLLPKRGAAVSGLQAQVVLTSRKLIAAYVLQTYPDIPLEKAEIWLAGEHSYTEAVLPGFGEAVRLRTAKRWRWANILLVLLVVMLLSAMAITPTAQLYLRARQAYAAMAALQQKAAPVLQQREALVKSTDQLANLAQLSGKQVPPLQILKLITDALPDDTALTSLKAQGLEVILTGQTVNSAALMKQLGSKAGLRDVVAPTPAVKPLGAPRESFSIAFTLDPTELGAIP